jgi:4'-phosphopantetheinyl transferase
VTIDGEGIQVYSFDVDPRSGGVAELEGLLSAAELARADRFRFANDRGRYVRTHGTLRRILARFVRVSPAELAFEYGPQGKPVLARHHHGEPLHFNLSRSGGLAVVAVTRCGEVGIDVEQVRPLDDVLAIARRMFAPAECAALLALPEAERLPSFLWYWARKEAVVKAIGRGLSYSLQAFVPPPSRARRRSGSVWSARWRQLRSGRTRRGCRAAIRPPSPALCAGSTPGRASGGPG